MCAHLFLCNQSSKPSRRPWKSCNAAQEERDAVKVGQEDQVASYLELQRQLAAAKAAMRAVVNQPRHILPFLQPGRLVNVASSASGISLTQLNKSSSLLSA